MSIEDTVITAASAGVVAFLVLVAWLMGFRKAMALDADVLARELAAAEPGARIEAAAVGADGKSALAKLANGKYLIARAMADGVSLRAMPREGLKLRLREGRAIITFADVGFPALHVRLAGEAPAWLRELEARA